MKAAVALLLLGWLGLAGCFCPDPGAINLARRGVATQSSDYKGALPITGDARKSIDGVNDQDWYHGYCSHTNKDKDAWLSVDLKKSFKVRNVVLTLRSDCCLDRSKGLQLRIGNSPDNNNPVCGEISSPSSTVVTFGCHGMIGQYVSVVISGREEFLAVCELEVYGDPLVPACNAS